MNYDTARHNSYPEGCTLTNCTFVHVGEGTTGTISDTNYAEIGEDNTVEISDAEYISVGDRNIGVVIQDSSYVIIGNDNTDISVGTHTRDSGLSGSGADSVTITRDTYGTEITGTFGKFHKSKYTSVDGFFNSVETSRNVRLDDANGNTLAQSTVISMAKTNNNTIQASYMELASRQPFYEYSLVDKRIITRPVIPVINRQSDNTGTVLDVSLNRLINKSDNKDTATTEYTIVNGTWTEVKK